MNFNFLNKNNKYKHRVLTIDGGGLKGYFAVYSLWRLEEEYNIKILDEFDTFAGTSIGSLIAAGIVGQVKLKTILDAYENGEEDFFIKNNILKRMNEGFLPKYSNEAIQNYIKRFFGNYDFNDIYHLSNKGLIVYSTNLSTSEPAFFGTPNISSKLSFFEEPTVLLENALLASCAAPTFFPIVKIKKEHREELYADGALWANNPSLITYGLLKRSYNLKDNEMKILSFGYTKKTDSFLNTTEHGKKILETNKTGAVSFGNLVNSSLSITSFLNDFILKTNLSKDHYKRIDIPSDKEFGLDTLSEEFKELAREAYESRKEEIKEFIVRKKWK